MYTFYNKIIRDGSQTREWVSRGHLTSIHYVNVMNIKKVKVLKMS